MGYSNGDTSFATYPAQVRIKFSKYFRKNPFVMRSFVMGIAGTVLLIFSIMVGDGRIKIPSSAIIEMSVVFFGSIVGFICALAGLMNFGSYWRYFRWKFHNGCINPAVVVSTEPLMLAVYTDLSKFPDADYPVIKFIHQPLTPSDIPGLKQGTKVATVSAYAAGDADDHWQDFVPDAIALGTDDQDEIDRVTQSIDEKRWQELEEGLKQVPTPYTPGLVFLESQGRWTSEE